MIQSSWGNLQENFSGKGIRPGKLGDTVYQGKVNWGFTVFYSEIVPLRIS
jgi:hypothetical protein